MNTQAFSHNDLTINFKVFGAGKIPLFSFHGFGRTGQDFELLTPYLEQKHTIYAFDLFLHGKSPFPKDRIVDSPITELELKSFFIAFIAKKNIDFFSIMGYSLGGKVALSLLQYFPSKIKDVYLLAPDGIVLNRWYNFASRSIVGKFIYQYITENPQGYFFLLKTLQKVGIIRKKMYHFLRENMKTKDKRQLVYDVWVVFSLIEPNILAIKNSIRQYNIKCYLFFGKHDNIIKPKIGKEFVSDIQNYASLYIINCGHVLIREQTGKILQQIIQNEK